MAEHCLRLASGLILDADLPRVIDVPGRPPRDAAVVAARGVFSAPLEWVALLAAVGARVHLKAPGGAPAFCLALTEAFRAEGLPVLVCAGHTLPAVDALVAMGSDQTMGTLAAAQPQARLSLHGHRFSVAVVRPGEHSLAPDLALDAALYDGRGCFTPAAVFVLGAEEGANQLARELADAMDAMQRRLPLGRTDPLLGPERRRRLGLARVRGQLRQGPGWAVPLLSADAFEPAALPRLLPVHPVASLEQVAALLRPRQHELAACATDLADPTPLLELGFERICLPGRLQAPPFGRCHGGREALRPLMRHASLELG